MGLFTSIALWTAGIGSMVSGITGGIMQYNQDKDNAEAEAKMLEYNSELAKREAADAENEMHEALRRQQAEAARFQGTQRALYGKTGVMMDTGSPLAVLGLTSERLEMDKIDTQRQGRANQQRFLNQSDAYLYQSKIAKRNYSWSSILSGAGTALGGVGMVANGFEAFSDWRGKSSAGAKKSSAQAYGFGTFGSYGR